MSWIKRNLYFLIGSAIALALIGLAGWFLYTKWQLNGDNLAKLNADYATLSELNGKKPHPGNDKIDNIAAAVNQTTQLLAFKEKARAHFQRILPIPDVPKAELTDQSFATNFSRTINQLQRDATNASITVPADYYFSFQGQARKLSFAAGSLETLSRQLGEVKALCDVLFNAKINQIDGIRRECVSPDDKLSGSSGDYLPDKSLTNAQAVISPYELTFRCFSQELGSVVAGFACSPYSIVIKALNVEGLGPGDLLAPTPAALAPTPPPAAVAAPSQPVNQETEAARRSRDAAIAQRRINRYGLAGAGFARPTATPTPAQVFPQPTAAQGARAGGPAAKPGSTIALDDRQLKVVMLVSIVKLDSKPAAPAPVTPASKPAAPR